MKRAGAWLLLLAAWGWAAAAPGMRIGPTPRSNLQSAQVHYARGTNHLAEGRFRKAERDLDMAVTEAAGGLLELERRGESIAVLRDQAEVLRKARERFDGDWEEAVAEAEAVRAPLQGILDTLDWRDSFALHGLGSGLDEALALLDLLSRQAGTDNRTEAVNLLSRLLGLLDGEIAAFESLQSLAGEFRALAADAARAREELERAKKSPGR